MSIKFNSTKTTVGNIVTTTRTTSWFKCIHDEHHNEIATLLTPYKVEVSSITKQLEGSKFCVYVDTETGVPCGMEHDDYGEIGGLWFEKKRLVDYDGAGLPKSIIKTIRALGFTVPRDFE